MIVDTINTIRTFQPDWIIKEKYEGADEDTRNLFKTLLREESLELFDEIDKNSQEGRILETIDVVYVALNNIVEMGISPSNVIECFKEMKMSQMSKLCSTYEEAEETLMAYGEGTHPHKLGHEIICHAEKLGNGKYIIRRSSDNKYMKSINFKKANIKRFLMPE